MFPEREQLYPLMFNERKSSGRSFVDEPRKSWAGRWDLTLAGFSSPPSNRCNVAFKLVHYILAASTSFRWLIRLAGWADATNDPGERCYILILMLPKYDRHSKVPVLNTWGEGRASRPARPSPDPRDELF